MATKKSGSKSKKSKKTPSKVAKPKGSDKRETSKKSPKKKKPQVAIPLDELDKYKVLHLHQEINNRKAAVLDPLQVAAQQKLDAATAELNRLQNEQLSRAGTAALAADAAFQQALDNLDEHANQIIVKVTPDLPKGYAVSRLNTEDDEIICEYNPKQRGELFELRRDAEADDDDDEGDDDDDDDWADEPVDD